MDKLPDKEQLDRIETLLKEIKMYFGIGSNVVHLADIQERARKAVERSKHGRKNTQR